MPCRRKSAGQAKSRRTDATRKFAEALRIISHRHSIASQNHELIIGLLARFHHLDVKLTSQYDSKNALLSQVGEVATSLAHASTIPTAPKHIASETMIHVAVQDWNMLIGNLLPHDLPSHHMAAQIHLSTLPKLGAPDD